MIVVTVGALVVVAIEVIDGEAVTTGAVPELLPVPVGWTPVEDSVPVTLDPPVERVLVADSPPLLVDWETVEDSVPEELGSPVETDPPLDELSEVPVEEAAESVVVADEEPVVIGRLVELTYVPVAIGELETGVRVIGVRDGEREAEELETTVFVLEDSVIEDSVVPAAEEEVDEMLVETTGVDVLTVPEVL